MDKIWQINTFGRASKKTYERDRHNHFNFLCHWYLKEIEKPQNLENKHQVKVFLKNGDHLLALTSLLQINDNSKLHAAKDPLNVVQVPIKCMLENPINDIYNIKVKKCLQKCTFLVFLNHFPMNHVYCNMYSPHQK